MEPRFAAIVTGASEGLGKAFALELASRKINLVLVALKDTGLCHLSNYIKRNYEVEVLSMEYDLTSSTNCSKLFVELESQGVVAYILINNAGIGNLSMFQEKESCFYLNQITLNVITPVIMTKLFLNQSSVHTKKYILNVGSLGSRYLVPGKQVYGATKSFISYFTKSMQAEFTGSSVSFSLLSPGGINTKPELLVANQKLKGIAKASITEAGRVAYEGIKGLLHGKQEIIPGQINRILVFITTMVPQFFQRRIMLRNFKSKMAGV